MKRSLKMTLPVMIAAATLLLAACGGSSEPSDSTTEDSTGSATEPVTTDEPRELRIGAFQEPTSFDPAQAQEGHYMPYYQAVYDTLIKREPDGSLSPMLATAWEYDEDLTALTLTLRDDVMFTDGEAFDAEAVRLNIEHFIAATGPQASQAASIESVEVVGDHTVTIHLSTPDPALPISLTNALGLMASPAAVGTEEIAAAPVGSGPYTLDRSGTIVGSQYSFVRNDDYWGESEPWSTLVMVYLPDETARLNALKSGQINTSILNPPSAEEAENSGLQLVSAPVDYAGIIFFDRTGQREDALGDARVRQALIHAIDKEAMVRELLLGNGEVTSQIFGPSTLGFVEELEDYYSYDPDLARELLAEAGYADGLTVDMPISPAVDPGVYTAIIQYWNNVGVQVTRTEYGPGEILPAFLSGEHALGYMPLFQPNDWQAITQYVAPDATWNPLGTQDSTVDGLIEQVRMAPTDEERAEPAQALNTYLVENAWFGTLYRPAQIIVFDDTVEVTLQAEQAVPSIYNYEPAG